MGYATIDLKTLKGVFSMKILRTRIMIFMSALIIIAAISENVDADEETCRRVG